jgi:hypothetical protein
MGNVRSYPISSIKDIMEIKYSRVITFYLSDPIVKLSIIDNDGSIKTYIIFPRDDAFPELKKILHLD